MKMKLITLIKGDHHRKENTPLAQLKVTMTTDDRITFATVCILEGNSKFAEMFLLANCAVMLAGRGSHVAASSLDDISVCIRDDEINPTYSILYQATTRYKT